MRTVDPFLGSGKSKDEILAHLDAELERGDAQLKATDSSISIAGPAGPDYDRALPRLYLDIEKLVHDPRRMHFEPGHRALYDSLLLVIAALPGAKLPWRNMTKVVARALDAPVESVQQMLDVALEEGLLLNNNGELTNQLVTEAHKDGVNKCFTNAISGKKGGKTTKKKRPKVPG